MLVVGVTVILMSWLIGNEQSKTFMMLLSTIKVAVQSELPALPIDTVEIVLADVPVYSVVVVLADIYE
jgi:hypothetical protein